MHSMPMPLSDVRGSRDSGVEVVVQRIQQLLFRNHSPDRSMVELQSRRNKYTHTVSSRQQVCYQLHGIQFTCHVAVGTRLQFGSIRRFTEVDS